MFPAGAFYRLHTNFTDCLEGRSTRPHNVPMKFTISVVVALAILLPAGKLTAADFTRETRIVPADSSAGDEFGGAVAIEGDTAVVGATGGAPGGAAYVFVRSGGGWVQQQKLVSSHPEPGGDFGGSVAISGGTIVIGAPHQDPGNVSFELGSVFVFMRTGGVWSLQQELQPDSPQSLAEFGNAVAIEGDTIVVGNRVRSELHAHDGAAYVFVRAGNAWNQQAKLLAFDADVNDFFGTSVAISGGTIAIGANADDDLGDESGSVYVFVNNGVSWVLQQKLLAGDGTAGDFFGISAALQGNTLVVGADRAGPLDAPGPGAAYVFVRNGGVWTQQGELLAADLDGGDGLGHRVGISGDTAVVSAYLDDHGGENAGSAYVFVRAAGIWSQSQKLQASDGYSGQDFGTGAAISGDTIIVGAEAFDGPLTDAGAGYIYERDTVPPVIAGVTATPNVLWPPNHKMVSVTITVTATDNFGEAPVCAIVSVTSSEPMNGQGDGDSAPDWQVTGPLTLNLRAERSGQGGGRIYAITVACEDGSGNSSAVIVNVSVPH
jgi:hypothetical protein